MKIKDIKRCIKEQPWDEYWYGFKWMLPASMFYSLWMYFFFD